MSANQNKQEVMRKARGLLDLGFTIEETLNSSVIPVEHRDFVRGELEKDANFELVPVRTISARKDRQSWIYELDRSSWHYWPALRQYLLSVKGWDYGAVRSLDDSSDGILAELDLPTTNSFDIRGLVVGFVQSGKTSSYTAVAAKAADAGFRFIIVLSGTDNGLRRQTNIRLKKELVGHGDGRKDAVRLPPIGLQWHEFTREDFDGDFRPGFANHAALQGSQPVLLVVKKNGAVLRRLLEWLDGAPAEVLRNLPTLIIDDEADQASIDTRGSYRLEDDEIPEDYEPPAVINGLIRDLLNTFTRKAYVAYTATPFANVFIPHDTYDPSRGNDLYPKDFIIDLPKPEGYFGAEEFFGRMDDAGDDGGVDLVNEVSHEDADAVLSGGEADSLRTAIMDFVLSGAARGQRGQDDKPATMLVHTSHKKAEHTQIHALVSRVFTELRDEWRYQREHGVRARLKDRWDSDFRPCTRATHSERDVEFDLLDDHIGPFMEAVQVKTINSETGDVLNYEREPSLKAIAIGGNRLARGLTLEGLTVSYFVRRAVNYDTLMQMGRWFGFRAGYEDLIRIWTTAELADWFCGLAFMEHLMRQDLKIYEDSGATPIEVGMRIWQHQFMQVTSRLKRRFANTKVISMSFDSTLQQTFKFPLGNLPRLAAEADANLTAVKKFLPALGKASPSLSDKAGPVWENVSVEDVLAFLREFQIDPDNNCIPLAHVIAYIESLRDAGKLTNWAVAVRGRERYDENLGKADWGTGHEIRRIQRTRLKRTDSVGVVTNPDDEMIGLDAALRTEAESKVASGKANTLNNAARSVRHATDALLLLYPISKNSGYKLAKGKNRGPLFDDVSDSNARDLIGMAISFPNPGQPTRVETYLEGTVGWRPME